MCILRLRSIVMTKNKRLQVQSRVVFIMNEHFNIYNPWWPREDTAFCPSCLCCFADRPRIHTDFSLIPCCDNPWKDADFVFSLWAVLYVKFCLNEVCPFKDPGQEQFIYIHKRLKCSTTTSKKMLEYNKNNYKSTKRL